MGIIDFKNKVLLDLIKGFEYNSSLKCVSHFKYPDQEYIEI